MAARTMSPTLLPFNSEVSISELEPASLECSGGDRSLNPSQQEAGFVEGLYFFDDPKPQTCDPDRKC